MPNSVAGQFYDVVSCQVCETDVTFQKGASAWRIADGGEDLEITCHVCGHLGLYRAALIRQAQVQYPL